MSAGGSVRTDFFGDIHVVLVESGLQRLTRVRPRFIERLAIGMAAGERRELDQPHAVGLVVGEGCAMWRAGVTARSGANGHYALVRAPGRDPPLATAAK